MSAKPTNPANQSTPRFLVESEIRPGMRVLDLGCGSGDLTRQVALQVGPDGEVIGVDANEAALEIARASAEAAPAAPISYAQVDLAGALPDWAPFDAVIGRRVLMYLPHPAATLRQVADLLKPGGIVAFQEHAANGMPIARGPLPVHAELHDAMWETVGREGGHTAIGLTLPALFGEAGLVVDRYRAEAVVVDADDVDGLPRIAEAMLPRMRASGLPAASRLDLDTLGSRLRGEIEENGGPLLWDMAYLIVGRRPG